MSPNPESIPLPFFLPYLFHLFFHTQFNYLLHTGFLTIQTFLEFSPTLDLGTTLLIFCLLLSHSFSISLLDSSFSTLLFSPYSLPLWVNYPQNCNIYLLMFWKLQFKLLFHIPEISTWMCTDTSHSVFPTLVLTLSATLLWRDLLLRCHSHSPSYWSQKSKHAPWVLSLSSPNPWTSLSSDCFTS